MRANYLLTAGPLLLAHQRLLEEGQNAQLHRVGQDFVRRDDGVAEVARQNFRFFGAALIDLLGTLLVRFSLGASVGALRPHRLQRRPAGQRPVSHEQKPNQTKQTNRKTKVSSSRPQRGVWTRTVLLPQEAIDVFVFGPRGADDALVLGLHQSAVRLLAGFAVAAQHLASHP